MLLARRETLAAEGRAGAKARRARFNAAEAFAGLALVQTEEEREVEATLREKAGRKVEQKAQKQAEKAEKAARKGKGRGNKVLPFARGAAGGEGAAGEGAAGESATPVATPEAQEVSAAEPAAQADAPRRATRGAARLRAERAAGKADPMAAFSAPLRAAVAVVEQGVVVQQAPAAGASNRRGSLSGQLSAFRAEQAAKSERARGRAEGSGVEGPAVELVEKLSLKGRVGGGRGGRGRGGRNGGASDALPQKPKGRGRLGVQAQRAMGVAVEQPAQPRPKQSSKARRKVGWTLSARPLTATH